MSAGTDILQHALDLERSNGVEDKRTTGRRLVGGVCERLGLPSVSRRLILSVLEDHGERPRVPMSAVYRYLGVSYRTWRRWMTEDPAFAGLAVTYRNPTSALLFVDELEPIFNELSRRKGIAYSVAELAQETNKRALA